MKTRAEAVEYYSEWKVAYQLAFGDASKSPAFDDLAAFCYERETCVVPGDRDESYVREGRRQVILRIRNLLDLTPEQLVEKYTRPAKGAISHDDSDPA